LPGGFIGVHSGLVVAARTESELASVIAHEIGHVTQRHIARMLAQQRQSTPAVVAAMLLAALVARSNPEAAVGAMTMAAGAQQQQMLAFSRDAEREADRIGLDTLRGAGFDPTGMVDFFGRLQQANRLYDGNAPAYMRSHPLTVERIADMRARIRDERYRQRVDSIELRLLRARLGVLGNTGVDALRASRARLERGLRDRSEPDEVAAWFALAVTALAQRDFPVAQDAVESVRARLPGSHPYVERLAGEIRLAQGDARGALSIAQTASRRFFGARALSHLQARALIEMGELQQAATFLEDQLALYKADPALWQLMSRVRSGLGQTALAHRAVAEEYALVGGWLAAVEQLRLAQRAGALDFYTASEVDARLREFQAEYAREQQDRARNR
jgi:predicted Zn-dependent protease